MNTYKLLASILFYSLIIIYIILIINILIVYYFNKSKSRLRWELQCYKIALKNYSYFIKKEGFNNGLCTFFTSYYGTNLNSTIHLIEFYELAYEEKIYKSGFYWFPHIDESVNVSVREEFLKRLINRVEYKIDIINRLLRVND